MIVRSAVRALAPRGRVRGAAACFLSLSVAACSGNGGTGPSGDDLALGPALADFGTKVAVSTYADLAAKAEALHGAASSYAASPGDASRLQAAAAAWVAAREPWEASEAFLFGPAAFLSLDPSLDSWPVDRQQLDQVLASGLELTPELIAEGLGPALRGFHTIEFLLFRDRVPRDPADVTDRERSYLVSCCRVLADDATALHDEWNGGFAAELAAAGTSGSRYRAPQDALLEILNGMVGICDEVANGKIATPYDEQDARLVESRFSGNSLTDFADNLRSVRNAYTGGFHLAGDGTGLDELVGSLDPELDARLLAELDAAVAAIGAIPAPFSLHLDAATEIEAAQAAIATVQATLAGDVKPLLLP